MASFTMAGRSNDAYIISGATYSSDDRVISVVSSFFWLSRWDLMYSVSVFSEVVALDPDEEHDTPRADPVAGEGPSLLKLSDRRHFSFTADVSRLDTVA